MVYFDWFVNMFTSIYKYCLMFNPVLIQSSSQHLLFGPKTNSKTIFNHTLILPTCKNPFFFHYALSLVRPGHSLPRPVGSTGLHPALPSTGDMEAGRWHTQSVLQFDWLLPQLSVRGTQSRMWVSSTTPGERMPAGSWLPGWQRGQLHPTLTD